MMKKKYSIIQRTKKDPITFIGEVPGRCRFGPVALKITATPGDWIKIRKYAANAANESDNIFLHIANHVFVSRISDDGLPRDQHIKEQFKQMKVIAALLFCFFRYRKSRTPLKAAVRIMGKLYPDKVDIFNSSSEDARDTDIIERFRITYVTDGKKILQGISDKNSPSLEYFDLLLRDIGNKIQESTKKNIDDLILAFNIVAASFVFFDVQTDYRQITNPFHFPEYIDHRFDEIHADSKNIFSVLKQ